MQCSKLLYTYCFSIQSKKLGKQTWRAVTETSCSTDENEIGQLMLYLTAAHLKKLASVKKGTMLAPNLGLYMKDLMVSVCVCVCVCVCVFYNALTAHVL